MVTWILESDVFSERCFGEMITHFKENDIPHHVIRVIPFVHEVEGKVPNVTGPVVVYGSIGVQKVARRAGWTPGVWTSEENFNYEAYRTALGDLILNGDCKVMKMSEVSAFAAGRDIPFFIKPNGDTKEFAGQLMESDEFATWFQKMIDIGYLDGNDFDVVVSEPKRLGREWRVVVVDGKISSASVYRQYQMVKPQRGIIPEVESVVLAAHSRYIPAPVYVIDVAETDDGFKVVEYNTMNSAGLYDCDVGKIINDINRYLT